MVHAETSSLIRSSGLVVHTETDSWRCDQLLTKRKRMVAIPASARARSGATPVQPSSVLKGCTRLCTALSQRVDRRPDGGNARSLVRVDDLGVLGRYESGVCSKNADCDFISTTVGVPPTLKVSCRAASSFL